jgi:hypothetical protein
LPSIEETIATLSLSNIRRVLITQLSHDKHQMTHFGAASFDGKTRFYATVAASNRCPSSGDRHRAVKQMTIFDSSAFEAGKLALHQCKVFQG